MLQVFPPKGAADFAATGPQPREPGDGGHAGGAGHIGGLAHVTVLEQPLLRHVGLLQVYAELEVAEHDLLYQLLAHVVIPLFGFDHIVERVQSPGGLPCTQESVVI